MKETICVFGDSIAFGSWDPEGGGWAQRLKSYIWKSDDIELKAYNLSISGNNTKDVLKRFENESIVRSPDLVIFAIGINDSQYNKDTKINRVRESEFVSNLEKLIIKAREISAENLFIGLTKVDERKTIPIPWALEEGKSYSNKEIEKYDKLIEKVCEKNNVKFIPMFDLLKEEDLEDGLHPNSQGHEKMFQRIKDFLEKEKII